MESHILFYFKLKDVFVVNKLSVLILYDPHL
jgi:hypothetical protein